MILALIDPWIPIIGDVGRVMIPILAVAAAAGLVLVFKSSRN